MVMNLMSSVSDEYKDETNNKVLGEMKSEVGSKIITEFCALSPKSYCYKYCEKEVKKAKGVSLNVSEKTMAFCDYEGVMSGSGYQTRDIYGIRSFKPTIIHNANKQGCPQRFLRSDENDRR